MDMYEHSKIESLYRQYLQNTDSVDDNWRVFFEGYEFAQLQYPSIVPLSIEVGFQTEYKVINLINSYRLRGHLFTKTNPIRERRKYLPTLNIENFGIQASELETVFHSGSFIGMGDAKLKDIIAHLEATYCKSVGVEYKYIRKPEVVNWLEERMERTLNTKSFSTEEKKRLLMKVNEVVEFERFIHKKYIGQKSFSLEGCEGLIPALDSLINLSAEEGVEEFVIGMSHRGRLNVLANIIGKPYQSIFSEFQELEYDKTSFAGDVKYHLGFTNDVLTDKGKKVHLSLVPNPSHLEAVDPVAQGIVRSKIDDDASENENRIIPILIHGDAAVAAQGIVYEVIQMAQLKGYKIGGTIHIVINNQIGFTTNYLDARSSTYCTDVAKVTLSPVFHVNGDDLEAIVYTLQLAMEYRQQFHSDVFIDILSYRKFGHNENDEPRFTQPHLYKDIATHPNLRDIYAQKLLMQGDIDVAYVKTMEEAFKAVLQKNFDDAKEIINLSIPDSKEYITGPWKGYRFAEKIDFETSINTGVAKNTLIEIGERITDLPAEKKFFDKTVSLFNDRKKMIQTGEKINWAMGELLAFGSLVLEGFPVRFSGQDVERGTFSQRHAIVYVEETEEPYCPLNHIQKGQAPFYICNSLLSEYAVLGFEYGYAMSSPGTLVIWEAQFGDFNNGAQIIIDQYLSNAEDKWKLMNGIVLLLPHGYEGQGTEHSSARLERFLQLCAKENMQIVNCTTPANFFHVLRRQMKRDFRKPLLVFTPKSLLRHPLCTSTMDEMVHGGFKEVIDDVTADVNLIVRVVFCTGKIYYELLERKIKDHANHIAIIRIEQLYPLPEKQFQEIIAKYKGTTDWIWVQEEPENMGAWNHLLRTVKGISLKLISRPESASAATGSYSAHFNEQTLLIDKVFEQ